MFTLKETVVNGNTITAEELKKKIMENLPIDTKSLPSRIFHSETEDKIYVGEPGNYKEIGGGGDGLPPSETGKFLVGGTTDWEKRGITGSDLVDSPPSAGVRLVGVSFTTGVKAGYAMSANPSTNNTVVQWSSGGVLKGNDAIESDDLVPLGQLEGMLNDIDLQKTLDNGNIADGVGIILTDGSSTGQYYADGTHINVGTTAVSMSKAEEGFLYAGDNGRVHLGDRNGVVGLNFETLTNKMNIVPPTSFGNFTHTLQNKSGTLAHLEDIGDVADGSVTNAKLASMSANSIKGRAATSAGAPSDIAIAANRLVGRGSTGNVGALTVGGGLAFSGTQLISDVYRDNYELSPTQTQDTWIDDSPIFKMTFSGSSTGEQQIDLTSFGIDSIILIEGMYVANDNSREVPCNYQRLLTPATNADIEVTTCYRNPIRDELNLSWHEVLSGTVRPVEFTYKVTIKYVKS